MLSAFVFLVVISVALAQAEFDCGAFHNNCVSCIQATGKGGLGHSCSFCPVDGMCHTVGSLFNKCSKEECVSLSEASQCQLKTIDDCPFYKYGKKHLR